MLGLLILLPWLHAAKNLDEVEVSDLRRVKGATEEAWWRARDAEAREWLTQGGLTEEIEAWLDAYADTQPRPLGIVDHRDGTTLWVERRRVELPAKESKDSEDQDSETEVSDESEETKTPKKPRYRWEARLFAQGPGDEFPGVQVDPDPATELDPDSSAQPDPADLTEGEAPTPEPKLPRLCGARLGPGGRTLVAGRTQKPPEDGPKQRDSCLLTSVDLDTGFRTELGLARDASVSWSPDGASVLVSRTLSPRRTALVEVPLDGGEPMERYRSRRVFHTWWLPDGTVIARSNWLTRGKRRHLRVVHGSVDALAPFGRWPRIPWLEYSELVGWQDGELLVRTDLFDPGTAVYRIDPEHPRDRDWVPLVAGRPGMDLMTAAVHQGSLLTVWSRDGRAWLEEAPYEGGPGHLVDLGVPATKIDIWRASRDEAVVQAWTPSGFHAWLRTADGSLVPMEGAKWSKGPEARTLIATDADGLEVPITWVGPPAEDGPVPVALQVYGGFGHSQALLGLSDSHVLILEAGGAVGIVHARGGRERGGAWHEAAKGEAITRTFADVELAARWLAEEGYTSRGQIVLSGASNGGLTVAATLARDPGLYAGFIGTAGVYDLVEARRIGRWWPKEYGRLRDADHAALLASISPVHQQPEQPLPPTLAITGARDPTVAPVHSLRLAAAWSRLPGGPALLLVDPLGSHGGSPIDGATWSAPPEPRMELLELAYKLRVLGLTVPPLPSEESVPDVHPGDVEVELLADPPGGLHP